jgi:hypothetical protein
MAHLGGVREPCDWRKLVADQQVLQAQHGICFWLMERKRIGRSLVSAVLNKASWGLMERLDMTRRPDMDFGHPSFEEGHPLHRHIVYVIERLVL